MRTKKESPWAVVDGIIESQRKGEATPAWLASFCADKTVAEAQAEGFATVQQIATVRRISARAAWEWGRKQVAAGAFEVIQARTKTSHRTQMFRPVRR